MTVVLVTDRWDEDGGGREQYLIDLVDYLTRHGHGVKVLCRYVGRRTMSVPLTVCRGPAALGEPALRQAVAAIRRASPSDPVLAIRPVVGATHYQLRSGIYEDGYEAEREAIASRWRRAGYRAALRVNVRRQMMLREERAMMATSDPPRLMVFTQALAARVAVRWQVPSGRLTIAPAGIDLATFRPGQSQPARPENPRPVRLLFVAQNFELKGLRPLLSAVATATRGGHAWHLTVVGSGRAAPYRAQARRAGLADRIVFEGRLSREALAAAYRRADVLVHPTFYDPLPRVVLEALSCGCPVVTTRRCGAAELITPGREGFLIDAPQDVDALVAAISRFEDPARRRAMREHAAAVAPALDFHRHAQAVLAWLAG